jgi:H+/Cl- antiporter ClcA
MRWFRLGDRSIVGVSPLLLALSLVVGVVGGALGALYLLLLHVLQRWLWPDEWMGHGAHAAIGIAILGGVGVGVSLLTRVLGSPGDVELLVDNIHVAGGPSDVRTLRSVVPASLLTIASGGAAGPEAPLVTTTGTLAAWVARTRNAAVADTRALTIAGMAAAFSVLFGAPLGSALFALEILHRRGLQYHEALVPSIIGGLSGYGMWAVLTRAQLAPVWNIPDAGAIHAVDLLLAIGAGVVGALVAVVFTYLTLLLRRGFARLPRFARPIVGGLVLGALGWWSPYALTFGEAQTAHVLTVHLLAGALAVAVIAKLLGTSVTVSSGWPGGFIIPLFFMGATLGQLGDIALPGSRGAHVAVLVSALMVAANVGVTKTLLGTTLVVTEMGGMHLLPTTAIAALVAFMLTSNVGLIHSQRERTPLEDSEAEPNMREEPVPQHQSFTQVR